MVTRKSEFLRVFSMVAIMAVGWSAASAQTPGSGSRQTSSTVRLTVDSTQAVAASSLEELIRGRASGVRVTSADGAPGAAFDVLVRGIKFIKGSNQPLYVLDGVILNPSQQDDRTGFWNDATDYQTVQGALGVIAPEDIQSIEILKDAGATAIYGSMGANGVVVITTKQGNTRTPKLSLNTNWGFAAAPINQTRRKTDMLDASQYVAYQGLNPVLADDQVNWEKEMMRNSFNQNYYVSLSGMDKAGKAAYYISGTFNNQMGVVQRTGDTGGSFRLNLDYPLSNWGKVGTRTLLSFGKINATQGAGPVGSMQMNPYSGFFDQSSVLTQMSLAAPYNFDSNFYSPNYMMENPSSMLSDYDDISREYRVVPMVYVDAHPFKWMTLHSQIGVDFRDKKRERWIGTFGMQKGYIVRDSTDFPYASGGMAAMTYMFGMHYNWDNTASVKFSGSYGTIAGTIGYSFNGSKMNDVLYEGWRFPKVAYALRAKSIEAAATIYTANYGTSYNYGMQSAYGTLSYSYGNRYFFDASLRTDNVVTLKTGWDQYPSLGAAWIASNEKFMQGGIKNVVSLLKLRGSWGRSGSKSLEPTRYFADQYQGFNTMNNNFFIRTTDTTAVAGVDPGVMIAYTTYFHGDVTQSNVGIDIGLIKNRVNVSVDHYWGTTSENLDVYYTEIVSKFRSPGWSSHTKMKLNGWDVSADALIINNKDWQWSMGANISFYAPEIVTATDNPIQRDANGNVTAVQTSFNGNSIGTTNGNPTPVTTNQPGLAPMLFYGFRTNGILDNNTVITAPSFRGARAVAGTVRYQDINGDFNIDDNDKLDIGNPNPKFSFGLNTSLSWKRFTLSTMFYGNYGNDIMNLNLLNANNTSGSAITNVSKDAYFKAWSQTNQSGTYPAIGAPGTYEVSDRLIEDGSFIRCDNITLGYKIPFGPKATKYVKALTVSAGVRNVFIITNYSGYDPEVDSYAGDITRYGIDMGSYPRVRTYMLGLSATF